MKQKSSKIIIWTIIFVFLNIITFSYASGTAVFEIGSNIKIKNPMRFGVNYISDEVMHWQSFIPYNQWIGQGHMEPIDFSHIGIASDGGSDFIEDKWIPGKRPGAGFWRLFCNGFWNDAEIRIYRFENGSIRLLRTDNVYDFRSEADTEEQIILKNDGPVIKKDDIYVLSMTKAEVPPYRVEKQREDMWKFTRFHEKILSRRIDLNNYAPDGHSRASMKVSLSEHVPDGAGLYQFFHGKRREWLHFEEGKRYVFKIWLKQEGMKEGRIQVNTRKNKLHGLHQTFQVSNTWKQYEFEFTGFLPQKKLVRFQILLFEKGTLWIDSIQIFEKGMEPYYTKPRVVKILKDFQPEVIRFWSGLTGGNSVENWLRHPASKHLFFDRKIQEKNHPSLPMLLRLCKETGASPWLITYPLMNEEETLKLMEYLGGGIDTAYGKLRADHGYKKPWTEEFDKIYIEVGNEMWNPFFSPRAFPGNPELAGAVAEYTFRNFKKSSHFSKDKIEFIIGGWTIQRNETGWGFRASTTAMSADWLSIGGYIGGWDGVHIPGEEDEKIFYEQLMYSPRIIEPGNLEHLNTFRRKGRKLSFAVYEGGGGYDIPTPIIPWTDESEYVGKSLASAVATLDQYMFNLSMGFGPQCFFKLGGGYNWNSHSLPPKLHPNASWIALKMRNNYLKGDLVETKSRNVPTINLSPVRIKEQHQLKSKMKRNKEFATRVLPGRNNVPLVICHAFQEGNRYSIMLISRQLKNQTDVELIFPTDIQAEGTILRLAGKPSATNRKIMPEVVVKEDRVGDIQKNYKVRLSPCSVVILIAYKK